MATQAHGVDISRIAAADLSASQFLAVMVNATGQVVVATAGAFVVGILQNKPRQGEAATVRVLGISKARAGATVAAGARVASNATGRIVTAAAGTTRTDDAGIAADPLVGSHVLGLALEGAANNDVFSILLTHSGAVPTTAA